MESEETVRQAIARDFRFVAEADRDQTASFLIRRIPAGMQSRSLGMSVISIVGGAAAGKSTFARALVAACEAAGTAAATISTDDFLIGTREYRRQHLEGKEPTGKYDFARLNAVVARIRTLRPGERLCLPVYDEVTGAAITHAAGVGKSVGPLDALIVEGDFDAVSSPDLRVYVHAPDNLRLSNRMRRDAETRPAANDEVSRNFALRQALQHIPYTLPALQRADILLCVVVAGDGPYRFSIYERATPVASARV